MAAAAWVRTVANTRGEFERETKSRKWNVIEAFAVMTFVLVVLWLYAYPIGVLMKIESANTISRFLLFAGALYLLFVSPLLHRDTLESWGIGNPVALWRRIRGKNGVVLGVVVVLVTLGLAAAFYINWIEAADFLFRMKRDTAERLQETPLGKIIIADLGILLSVFFSTCVIRYDNFLPALVTAIKILGVLASLLYLAAIATMGMKAFSDFEGARFALDVFGYVFWGAIQQLLFCSYFGTRLRKGFAPAKDATRITQKCIWVAILNGAFFGLIHINSWYLVLVTWLLGCFLSYVFMANRNRNLIALGFVHGFLGSSVGWLFSRGKGQIEVEMGVGPWHVKGFDLPTMLVVIPLVTAFAAFIIYAYLRWKEE